MDYQDKEFARMLDGTLPDVPLLFDQAMEKTLAEIVASGRKMRTPLKRRIGLVVLAAVLILASIALAMALNPNVFEALLGTTPSNGQDLIQRDLARVSFDEVDVELREAAYDGLSLYLLYSIRDRNATAPVGEYDPELGLWLLSEETMPAMERDNVGWWFDTLWINGDRVGIPGMSSFQAFGSEVPGEILFYQLYQRLDQEGIYLSGETEIGLPILKKVDLGTLPRNQEGRLLIPADDEHVLYFTIDASAREGIVVETPNIETVMEDEVRVSVSSVTYSPIKLYITVQMEGVKGDDWGWPFEAELVDKNGKRVFETMEGFGNGCQSWGNAVAYFQYPYLETYPDEMYLAPMDGDAADMTKSVRVR